MRIFLSPEGVEGGTSVFDAPQESATESSQSAETTEPVEQSSEAPSQGESTEQQAVKLPGWTSGLRKDLQANEGINKFEKVSDFADDYIALKSRLENSIVKPGESSSPEELSAYRAAMGIPDTSDGYEFPEDIDGVKMDTDRVKQYSELAHKLGLSKDQAKALLEYEAKSYREAIINQQAARNNSLEAANKALREHWGEEYSKKVKLATRAFNTFSSKVDREKLDKTGILNNPQFVMFLEQVGSAMSEDTLVDGSPQSPSKSKGYITNYKM